MQKFLLIVCLAISACTKTKDRDDPIEPTPPVKSDFEHTADYLLANHLQGSWSIVSLKPDGSAEHQGEALLYAGVFLYSVPCAAGDAVEQGLIDMINANGGQLQRVDPLGEYADGRAVTFDGYAWLLAGVAHRVFKCPGGVDRWREPWRKLSLYQALSGGRLSDAALAVDARIDDEFTYPRDLITVELGLSVIEDHGHDRQGFMEKQIGGWAQLIKAQHVKAQLGLGLEPACYPVNLGLAFLLATEESGRSISNFGRSMFCAATSGMDIPTVDHYCGRSNLAESYIPSYRIDQWEFRHQRCGAWETPDGDGNRSPRVDLLLAYALAYRVQ